MKRLLGILVAASMMALVATAATVVASSSAYAQDSCCVLMDNNTRCPLTICGVRGAVVGCGTANPGTSLQFFVPCDLLDLHFFIVTECGRVRLPVDTCRRVRLPGGCCAEVCLRLIHGCYVFSANPIPGPCECP